MTRTTLRPISRPRGYTLVEVLVTVTVMALASAIVVPSLLRSGELGLQAAARMVIADVLFTQNDAIAYQAPRRIVFDIDNNEYRLEEGVTDNIGNVTWSVMDGRLQGGGGGEYLVDFDTDNRFDGVVIVAADFNGSDTLSFDVLGGPSSGGFIRLRFDTEVYRIEVAEFTGRVSVERE
ncbi:MAG: prepilin-type N-terminal cleavage/methylation domain-containing protein [Planctomycetota bacterium]